jgi:TPR repeat protein
MDIQKAAVKGSPRRCSVGMLSGCLNEHSFVPPMAGRSLSLATRWEYQEGGRIFTRHRAQNPLRFQKLLLVIRQEPPILTSVRLISLYRRFFGPAPQHPTPEATQAAAEGGDPDAQFALGLKFSTTKGPPVNLEHAAHWYRKAADQDHALAQFNLGIMFARGQGLRQDDTSAVMWIRRSAEGGDAGAQFNLGTRYHRSSMDRNQMDCVESCVEAYKWFRLAADQGYKGSAAACERVTLSMSSEEVKDGNARVAAFVARKQGSPVPSSSSKPK